MEVHTGSFFSFGGGPEQKREASLEEKKKKKHHWAACKCGLCGALFEALW